MQEITIELTLNVAFYQEHQHDLSREELKRELRREVKDQLNELNINGVLDLMCAIPALPLVPKVVICAES